MTRYRPYLINGCVLIIFFLSTPLRKCDAGRRHHETALCPSNRRLKSGQACDISTNCRYGGKCRKVADVSTDGTTTRYIIPLVSEDYLDKPPKHSEENSVQDLVEEHSRNSDSSRGTAICVCDFNCNPRKIREVCGTNGHTYPSRCHLLRDACRCQMKIRIASTGPCRNDTLIEDDKGTATVLAKHPHFAGNCERQCNYGGKCDDAGYCHCDMTCSQVVSYTCGKDGKTYQNQCYLQRAQCELQRGIDILHVGRCRTRSRPPRSDPCVHDCDTSIVDTVCGTDWVSYRNECLMKHASCKKRRRIGVSYKGPCKPKETEEKPDDDPCRDVYCEYGGVCVPHEANEFMCSCDAICSEEDLTRDNRLSEEKAESHRNVNTYNAGENTRGPGNKRRRWPRNKKDRGRRHRSRVARSIDGSTVPPNTILCGTDGKTYPNRCMMRIHGCHEGVEITIKHMGPCANKLLHQNSTQNDYASNEKPDVEKIRGGDIPEFIIKPTKEKIRGNKKVNNKKKGGRKHRRKKTNYKQRDKISNRTAKPKTPTAVQEVSPYEISTTEAPKLAVLEAAIENKLTDESTSPNQLNGLGSETANEVAGDTNMSGTHSTNNSNLINESDILTTPISDSSDARANKSKNLVNLTRDEALHDTQLHHPISTINGMANNSELQIKRTTAQYDNPPDRLALGKLVAAPGNSTKEDAFFTKQRSHDPISTVKSLQEGQIGIKDDPFHSSNVEQLSTVESRTSGSIFNEANDELLNSSISHSDFIRIVKGKLKDSTRRLFKRYNVTGEIIFTFSPSGSLKWYHVALISVATQILVATILVVIFVQLKQCKKEKEKRESQVINDSIDSPKEEESRKQCDKT